MIQQLGSPQQLYEDPRNVFVAGFVGSPPMNLVPAPVVDAGGSSLTAGFRPEHVHIANGAGDSVRFSAKVDNVEYLGDEQLIHALVKETRIIAKLPPDRTIEVGEDTTFAVPRQNLYLFDAETQERVN